MTQASSESFESISPTALISAYWRTKGDVPFAAELYDAALPHWEAAGGQPPDIDPTETYHAPTMEARQLVGGRLLRRLGVTQVLDIAAGLSPRGLMWLRDMPEGRYVEVDLPKISLAKRQAFISLGVAALDESYHVVTGDALDPAVLDEAAEHFDPDAELGVFCEGFLHYLNNDERARVAANILRILRRFGGAWVTDLPHHRDSAETQGPSFKPYGTGRDVGALAFPNRAAAEEFFIAQGFTMEAYVPFADIADELVSPRALGLSTETVREQQNSRGMYILRPQPENQP